MKTKTGIEIVSKAVQLASPFVVAFEKLPEGLKKEAFELFSQLNSGQLDEYQVILATTLVTDLLFPEGL